MPVLANVLEQAPLESTVDVHLNNLSYIDHACIDLLTSWADQHRKTGGKVLLEWDALHNFAKSDRPRPNSAASGGFGLGWRDSK